ncbi:DUF397 domain-containing protein [Streptomyces sp. NPDC003284]
MKSSYSGNNGNCIEIAILPEGGRAVRDSKDPRSPILSFTDAGWSAFVNGTQDKAFNAR